MHHLKNSGPNPMKVSPHQLVNRILSTLVAEKFDELLVRRVDHFGDCLFTRIEYSVRLDRPGNRILAVNQLELRVSRVRILILFQ